MQLDLGFMVEYLPWYIDAAKLSDHRADFSGRQLYLDNYLITGGGFYPYFVDMVTQVNRAV